MPVSSPLRAASPRPATGTELPPADHARIRIRLQPRASANRILGERPGPIATDREAAAPMILVRVTAPPVEGKANAALIKLIAGKLGLAKSKVNLIRGETGRDKVLEIKGMSETDARRRLLGRPARDH